MQNNLVYLSLGSNLGDKANYLKEAYKLLGENPQIRVTGKSSLYETEPVGYTEQDFFLNGVIEIETSLEPNALLSITRNIENQLGRKRTIHWGPRTIDIDILTFNEEVINEPELIIPHREMHRRRFVLIPLAELNPALKIPHLGPVRELLETCPDRGRVSLLLKSDQW